MLKEKEIKQFGEYRTRRLVLEAWDKLAGMEVGSSQSAVTREQKPEVSVQSTPVVERKDARDAAPVKEIKPAVADPAQPMLSAFGLYQCGACGKLVLDFDRENHVREGHKSKAVVWKKMR